MFATFGIGSGGTGLSSSAHARNGAATNSERDHVAVSKYLTRMISPFPKCAPKQSESMLGRPLTGGPIRVQPLQNMLIRLGFGEIVSRDAKGRAAAMRRSL